MKGMVFFMIYVFALLVIVAFIIQKDKILNSKKNITMYLLLSFIGLFLGILYEINPYMPSISFLLENSFS